MEHLGGLRDWGWLSLVIVAWACGSSTVRSSDDGQGGGSGDDDSVVGDDDETGGSTSGKGGAGGTVNGGGPTTGGVPPTGGGPTTGGVSGTGGSGGSSGAVADLGGSCSPPAALACAGNHQHVTLICGPDGAWVVNETCPSEQACDSTPGFDQGTCKPRIARCAANEPGYRYCRGTLLVECGPDSVNLIDVETCTIRCLDGACDDSPGASGAGGQPG